MEVGKCSSNPCMNDGTCADHLNEYICTCASGFTGINCGTGIFVRVCNFLQKHTVMLQSCQGIHFRITRTILFLTLTFHYWIGHISCLNSLFACLFVPFYKSQKLLKIMTTSSSCKPYYRHDLQS